MLLRPAGHPVRRTIEAWMTERGIRAQTVAETVDVDLMRALALQGRGIAVLGVNVVRDELASGRLVKLSGAPTNMAHEVWVAVPVRPPADEDARAAVETILKMKPKLGRFAAESA